MKNGQKLKLGDAHGTPGTCSRSINHQSLGMPPAPSCSSSKCFRSAFMHYVFIRSCNKCYLLERPLFSFQQCVVSFVVLNKRVDPSKLCFGERHAPLSLSRTLQFSLSLSCECSLFLVLRVVLHFMFLVRFSNEWCSWVIYDVLSGLK